VYVHVYTPWVRKCHTLWHSRADCWFDWIADVGTGAGAPWIAVLSKPTFLEGLENKEINNLALRARIGFRSWRRFIQVDIPTRRASRHHTSS